MCKGKSAEKCRGLSFERLLGPSGCESTGDYFVRREGANVAVAHMSQSQELRAAEESRKHTLSEPLIPPSET